jgi:DNA modification methylase
MLKDILLDLDTGAFDMDLTGFDTESIESLMTQLHEPEEGLTEDDAVPENVGTRCKKGDLWKLGEHRLLCGDSTVITDVERLMGGGKADLLTDPPYNVGLEYKSTDDSKTKADYLDWCREWFDITEVYCSKRIVFVGNVNFKDWLSAFNPEYIGIWDKGDGATTHGYITQYTLWEPVFFHGKFKRVRHNDVFRFVAGTTKIDHPCPKPVALIEDIVKNFCNETVLDLFLGSGSTLIACEKLGRKCYGMEIDPHYCSVILKRWEDFTGKTAELIKE